jgi:hypothetical protein
VGSRGQEHILILTQEFRLEIFFIKLSKTFFRLNKQALIIIFLRLLALKVLPDRVVEQFVYDPLFNRLFQIICPVFRDRRREFLGGSELKVLLKQRVLGSGLALDLSLHRPLFVCDHTLLNSLNSTH